MTVSPSISTAPASLMMTPVPAPAAALSQCDSRVVLPLPRKPERMTMSSDMAVSRLAGFVTCANKRANVGQKLLGIENDAGLNGRIQAADEFCPACVVIKAQRACAQHKLRVGQRILVMNQQVRPLAHVNGAGHLFQAQQFGAIDRGCFPDFQRSEEHTSELQSLMRNSYALFFLNKKNIEYH